jgi:hypothetical protein
MNMEISLFLRSESEDFTFSKTIKARGSATRVIGSALSNNVFAPFLNHLTFLYSRLFLYLF